MEFGGDSLVEIISGALYRKHIVEVRPSAFLYDSKDFEEVIFHRQSSVRNLTHFHNTQFSDTIYVQFRS